MDKMKYFTPEEAERTLPLVRQIVQDILTAGQQARQYVQTLGEEAESHPWIQEKIQEIQAYIQELEDIGCYFKDWNFEIGLVDFPAIINGEQVFLCWRSDETHIRYYHGIHEGYAGRKPIPPEYLFASQGADPNGEK